MKKLKNFIAIIALAILSISVNAQAQFGLKAGLNIANQKYTESGSSFTPDSKIGFHVGVISEISLSDALAIQPGLLFSQKGCKIVDMKMDLNYLDIPINIMYKVEAGNMKIFALAGPVISYALSGKFDGEDIEFGSGDNQMKKLDLGLNLGAGVQFSSIQISLQYSLGLTNLSNASDGTVKNNVLGISVAYLFGDN